MDDAVALTCTGCRAEWDQPIGAGQSVRVEFEFEEPVGVLLEDRWLSCPECRQRHGVLIQSFEQPEQTRKTADETRWHQQWDNAGDRVSAADTIAISTIALALLIVAGTVLYYPPGPLYDTAYGVFLLASICASVWWAGTKWSTYGTLRFGVPQDPDDN